MLAMAAGLPLAFRVLVQPKPGMHRDRAVKRAALVATAAPRPARGE
jgi:hypothetical protein